jgi:fatty acid desaturase
MNQLKKAFGIIWILLGPAAILFMLWQAYEKVGDANAKIAAATTEAAKAAAQGIATNTLLQWSIIIAIFVPIAFGMVIFGKYAMQGAYDHLPENSLEIEVD